MDLWMEGFRISGKCLPAKFCGTFEANTLRIAVHMYMDSIDSPVEKKQFIITPKTLSYWNCKFFDNEVDARRTFG